MKKLNIVILFVCIILICTGIYKLFFHEINEEFEVLNKDVSLNNIKSVMEVELEENENLREILLGYKEGKVYILKYTYEDMQNKIGKYDKTIYKIDENGLLTESEMNIPEEYCTSNDLNIYGNYIFCGGSYYDWTTGEKTIIFSEENGYDAYPVSGNKEYFLYKKSEQGESKYYLVNIKSKDTYEYRISNEYEDAIKDVFFDKDTSEFYGITNNDHIVKLNLNDSSFSTEIYDNEVKLDYSNEYVNNSVGDRYICSDKGQIYIGSSKLKKSGESIDDKFNISRYYLRDKYLEDIDSINVCGYDKYNSDCLLVKKKDDSSEKICFAKFKNNNMDILMEVPKKYGDYSSLAIKMSDDANLLVSETYYDTSNKKIDNRYAVYDLKEYFNDNEYVLNNDGTWTGKDDDTINLNNVYKNIDDSQRGNKENSSDKAENVSIPVKSDLNEDIEIRNKVINDGEDKKSEKSNESDDFIEHDSSWRNGNGDWYYVGDNDRKVTSGWIKNNGKWYYFDENGVMQKNAIVLQDGCEFTLDENGVLVDSDNNSEQYLKDKSKSDSKDKKNDIDNRNYNEENKNCDENIDVNKDESKTNSYREDNSADK